MPRTDIASFTKVLKESKHIIAVAGAGLSAASGLPTFRNAGGLWRKYKSISLATPEAFQENPSRVWQFYHYRREGALRASPNAAHYALARFTSPDTRQTRCPPGSTFTLITQNVDGLSPRALQEISSSINIPEPTEGHPHIIEMHGRLLEVICTKCKHVELNTSSPICEALGGTENMVDAGAIEKNIPVEQLPRCSKCGELTRPNVVWFGEVPHELDLIDELVSEADLCIVVGTSATVYPAAGYAEEVKWRGGKVAIFNLERTAGDEDVDFLFLGPCEETLQAALGLQI